MQVFCTLGLCRDVGIIKDVVIFCCVWDVGIIRDVVIFCCVWDVGIIWDVDIHG